MLRDIEDTRLAAEEQLALAVERVKGNRQEGLAMAELARGAIEAGGSLLSPRSAIHYALCLMHNGHFADARVRLLDADQRTSDRVLRGKAWQSLAVVEWRAGDFAEARRCIERTRELLADSSDCKPTQAAVFDVEGLVYFSLGQLPEALECLLRARSLWIELDDRDHLGRNAVNLACVHEHLGDHAASLEVAMDGRRALEGSSNLVAKQYLAINIASAHQALGDFASAREELESFLELRERTGDRPGILIGECMLAELALAEGRLEQAREWADVIAGRSDQDAAPAEQIEFLRVVAGVYLSLGCHAEARRCLERAWQAGRAIEDETVLTSARLTSIRLELAEGRYELALEQLEEWRPIFLAHGNVKHHSQFHELVGRAAEGLGRHELALRHERERIAALELLHEQTASLRVRSLQLRHRVERARLAERAAEASTEELEQRVEERTTELREANQRYQEQAIVARRVEGERRRLESGLVRAERLESLGRLAGGVAHDFNNLLTVVSGTARLLEDGLGDAPQLAELARQISQASEQGARLTGRLLAFGRRIELTPVATRVDQLLTNSPSLIQRVIGEGVEFELELDPLSEAGEVWVESDSVHFDSVLLNLALNARDAIGASGRLSMRTEVEDDCFVLRVSDTGHGIDPQLRDLIFDPFFSTRVEDGTGLGLSSALGIVQELGGTLELESSSSSGSTFRISLPRIAAPETLASADASGAWSEAPIDLSGRLVLLVEDDPAVRGLLAALLRHLGLQVCEASDGQEALDLVDDSLPAELPELVVCDVSMPRCTGPEFLARLRERGHATPVLLVSGWHGRYVEESQASDPRVAFLQKPIELEDLGRHLKRLLRVG